ncbi:AAA family ATPase [Rhizobium lusitanum]|uniref:AAA family ATPase n=1 Tax=Rhizobium lusitanum TaxID=293958 RepID=A0A6L9UIH5_9HYPH|nr:AAA family ATPase [Rhizobium lusitanum]NEI74388.1 AAA family ATPase [Rhizobium lusitanum]
MLIMFGGLPGTGKTTIARKLAMRLPATYLRVDEIEHAISANLGQDIGTAGYAVAEALARSNIQNGASVIVDAVNPVPESREAWRAIAAESAKPFLAIELLCGDPAEHRRRIEERQADIPGFRLPTWEAVVTRHYAPWADPHLVIDTARIGMREALANLETEIDATVHAWRASQE